MGYPPSPFIKRSPVENRLRIILEAMDWVGTPYHHQARVKKVGVDCAQLVAGVAEKKTCIYKKNTAFIHRIYRMFIVLCTIKYCF